MMSEGGRHGGMSALIDLVGTQIGSRSAALGHATFDTPDLDKAIDYYTQVVGLRARRPARTTGPILASKIGQLAIELRQGAGTRVAASSAFEVAADADFDDMKQQAR